MSGTYLGLNLKEAAAELRCSTGTVRRLVREGHLPRVPHMGTRIVIPRAAFIEWVNNSSEPLVPRLKPVARLPHPSPE